MRSTRTVFAYTRRGEPAARGRRDERQGLRDLGYRVLALYVDDLRRLRDDEAEPDLGIYDSSMSLKFAGPFQLTPADVKMLDENPIRP